MGVFNRLESEIRGYCRSFPTVFRSARGSTLIDERGRRYIDFLAGAGTLNYGHNHPEIKRSVIDYLERDGVLHGLDMHTQAKREFLETLEELIFFPREQDFKVQFTGPTGTNAVEAAFKLARKITGRRTIIAFTNAFHGVTLGSVAATGNSHFRNAAGVSLTDVVFMPYDRYFGPETDTLAYMRRMLADSSSGVDLPAAVVVETVQGEGGVNVAQLSWLRRLAKLCQEFDMLLIVDDIQVGCGRTGTFFSYEDAGISPDIVTLSKSLGAYGLPMSVVLIKSHLDVWKPGEHNGTFRGNNLAFVAATSALRLFWSDGRLTQQVREKGVRIKAALEGIARKHADVGLQVRGRGMIWGLSAPEHAELPAAISRHAFERGLIIETSGPTDNTLKLLPPLTIEDDQLEQGLAIVRECADAVIADGDFVREHQTTGADA